MNTGEEAWEDQVRPIRELAAKLLEEHFGERCEDYCYGCPCCERYKLLDQLLENPYL